MSALRKAVKKTVEQIVDKAMSVIVIYTNDLATQAKSQD
jgi:hypothetical protein